MHIAEPAATEKAKQQTNKHTTNKNIAATKNKIDLLCPSLAQDGQRPTSPISKTGPGCGQPADQPAGLRPLPSLSQLGTRF